MQTRNEFTKANPLWIPRHFTIAADVAGTVSLMLPPFNTHSGVHFPRRREWFLIQRPPSVVVINDRKKQRYGEWSEAQCAGSAQDKPGREKYV